MSKKIAVVTALIGAYDSQLLEFEYDKDKYDFICYTNMKRLKSETWDIRYVSELEIPEDNAKSSYWYKWNPHKYLAKSKYDTMVWVDSSFSTINMNGLDNFIERFNTSKKALFIEKHPGRNTLRDECDVNCQLKKDDIGAMKNQVERYFTEGYRDDYTTMVETGLSIRKYKNADMIALSESIWNELAPEGNTKRDQLVYDYCVWKNKFQDYALFTSQEKSTVITFQDHPHRSDHKDKVLLVGPWLGEEYGEEAWVRFVEDFASKTPVDSVVVGCRSGREHLYENLSPNKMVVTDPVGVRSEHLLDGRVPCFNITSSRDKDIIHLTADHEDFIDTERNIHILWATIRAGEFDEKYKIWAGACAFPEKLIPYIAVDTQEDKELIKSIPADRIIVVDTPRKGVTYPGYALSSIVESDNDNDIVVFASDDFEPMDQWDVQLFSEFTTYKGSLLVDDLNKPTIKDIMTIPIMTYYTLCQLNKIIYHPAYAHCWSDNELLFNLEEMGLVKDLRLSRPDIYFEHKHYATGGREKDDADKSNDLTHHTGKSLWNVRKQMPLADRLKYDPEEPLLSILILTLVEREEQLKNLLSILEPQMTDDVEIIVERDNRENTVGKKRNNALKNANGRYICFVDDDDEVAENYVESILNVISSTDVDCCSLIGHLDMDNGADGSGIFIHSLKYKEWGEAVVERDGKKELEYYRPPNHLNTVRRDIATHVGFDDTLSYGEDRDYSIRLRELLVCEGAIDKLLYYYTAVSGK